MANSEVGVFTSTSQFGTNGNTSECGSFAVATILGSAAPGGSPWSSAEIASAANADYIRQDGPATASNTSGMTQATLHTDLLYHALKYADVNPDWNSIKAAIWAGSPVVICIPESQVIDVELGASPYPWSSAGIDHIILVTGVASSNNVLVRDSANIEAPNTIRQGPREYKILAMTTIFWATAVTPGWKEKQMAATQNYDLLYANHVVLEKAYNVAVATKNDLSAQVTDLKAQLARATATTPGATTTNGINQAIAILQKLVV